MSLKTGNSTAFHREKCITAGLDGPPFHVEVAYRDPELSFVLECVVEGDGRILNLSLKIDKVPFEGCEWRMRCIDVFEGLEVRRGLYEMIKVAGNGKGCMVVEECLHDAATAFAVLSSFFNPSIIVRNCYAFKDKK